MAAYSGARTQHQTLATNTADTVTLDSDYDNVEVLNRATSGDIYFRVDGTAPTVGGAGSFIVTPGQALQVSVGSAGNTVVKLISSAATAYSVSGI